MYALVLDSSGRLTLFSQTPRSKHPLPPASPPPLRYHGTRGTCRSRRAFLRYVEYEQAPYTDPRTGLRYHDKSVYDLIKTLVRSLSLA